MFPGKVSIKSRKKIEIESLSYKIPQNKTQIERSIQTKCVETYYNFITERDV